MSSYDKRYFDFIEQASLDSARGLLPLVKELFQPNSVIDFGCGRGAWLRVWKELGVRKVLGADGEYINKQSLLISESEFKSVDLSKPVDLGETFALASCLEVGEHLPRSASGCLLQTLTHHSKIVLFSAAVPGQGGYCHVNEQPYEYWRALFARHNYCMLDVLRPQIQDVQTIEPWYAYNTFVFVDRSILSSFPGFVTESLVPEDGPIRDYSPIAFRIRKALLRRLPTSAVNALHTLKKHCVLTKRLAARSLQSN